MKMLAIIVNIFLPGIGTLLVGKLGAAIAQILLGIIAVMFTVTGIGSFIGVPLALIVWIWAIMSVVNTKAEPVQIIVQHRSE